MSKYPIVAGAAAFPEGITEIPARAFYIDKELKSVTIPEGVTKIGCAAFADCPKLKTVIIPDSVTEIDTYAFKECRSLKSIMLPKGLKTIADHLFKDCPKLEEITIPEGVDAIGERAFENCINLKHVTIPKGVKKIKGAAFMGCSHLESMLLPVGVSSIHVSCITRCMKLNKIYVPLGKKDYYVKRFERKAELFIEVEPGFVPVVKKEKPAKKAKDVNPDRLVMTSEHHAAAMKGLGDIDIPGEYQWTDGLCYRLQEDKTASVECRDYAIEKAYIANFIVVDGVEYPVTTIARNCFYECMHLKEVVLPSNIRSIKQYAFWDCDNIQKITFNGCRDIELGEDLPSIKKAYYDSLETFLSIGNTANAPHVYINGEELTNLVVPEGTVRLRSMLAMECIGLRTVRLPDSVEVIDSHAFCECKNLKSINLPEGLKAIGDYAFYKCKSLAPLTVPSSVTYIGVQNEVLNK